MRLLVMLAILVLLIWIVFWRWCLVGFFTLMCLGVIGAKIGGDMDDIKIWLAENGVWVGLAICTTTLLWDLIPWVRGFMEYSIRGVGAVGLSLGIIMIIISYSFERWIR